ncbi:hypothetical protein SLA_5438 [Streptomyces laurentii]|uniref:Uncharacterized protein n=1 Tax=Streptomyces laurentii TaxID=39478 RepID=A0A160P5I5_STRLU|nr:hypothetical protein SLA_5438 [Streptomyces laurentii]
MAFSRVGTRQLRGDSLLVLPGRPGSGAGGAGSSGGGTAARDGGVKLPRVCCSAELSLLRLTRQPLGAGTYVVPGLSFRAVLLGSS